MDIATSVESPDDLLAALRQRLGPQAVLIGAEVPACRSFRRAD
jgi:hypothetical protein